MNCKTEKRNQRIFEDVARYCAKNDLFEGIAFYFNGHKYTPEWAEGTVEKELKVDSRLEVTYYDHGECDVTEYLEYSNPESLTMEFEESVFYSVYNNDSFDVEALAMEFAEFGFSGKIAPSEGEETRDAIDAIAARYGMIVEQGNSWDLAFYEA